jgi:hypothetical protein
MGVYNQGKAEVARGHVTTTGAYTVMLCSTGYTFNQDHTLVDDGSTSDPKSYEIGVAYTRQTLGSVALAIDNTLEKAWLDATDPTFTAVAGTTTIGHVVIYLYSSTSTSLGTATTGDTGQVLLSQYDTTGVVTNGSNITFTLSTDGFLKFGTTT